MYPGPITVDPHRVRGPASPYCYFIVGQSAQLLDFGVGPFAATITEVQAPDKLQCIGGLRLGLTLLLRPPVFRLGLCTKSCRLLDQPVRRRVVRSRRSQRPPPAARGDAAPAADDEPGRDGVPAAPPRFRRGTRAARRGPPALKVQKGVPPKRRSSARENGISRLLTALGRSGAL